MTHATAKAARRLDADIFAEARHALDRPTIPGTVRVHVNDGVATLTGSVRLASERAEAEDVVRNVGGVQRVVNEITIPQLPSNQGLEPPEEGS